MTFSVGAFGQEQIVRQYFAMKGNVNDLSIPLFGRIIGRMVVTGGLPTVKTGEWQGI